MDFNQYVKGDSLIIRNTAVDVESLISFVRSNKYIKKLSLVSSNINPGCAKSLVCTDLPELTSLHLEGNIINYEGAKALANVNFPGLTSLHFKGSTIGDFGIEALSKVLKNGKFPELTSLHLEGDKIGDFGIEALSKALKNGKFPKLTSLHLEGNGISAKGVRDLGKALKNGKFPNLTSLHLEGDKIGDSSVEDLSEALKSGKFPNLTSLHLEGGKIGDFGTEALSKLSNFDCRWNKGQVTMLRRCTLKRKSSSEAEVSKASSKEYFKKFKSNEASQQQGAQTQFDQQQKPNAQAASAHSGSRWGKLATMLKRGIFKRKPCLELKVSTTEPEVSTTSSTKSIIPHRKKFKSDEASQQQGAQTQFDQQQKPNAQNTQQQAQATSDSTVPPMSRSMSSNLSSPGGSNNGQPGPSSSLSEVPPISRSQSLNSLHSDDSGTKIG